MLGSCPWLAEYGLTSFSNPLIFATWCSILIFQTINSVRSDSPRLKCQWYTLSGCKDIGIRTCEFVAKTQFLDKDAILLIATAH